MTNLEKISIMASIACILKFLAEGVTFTAFGSTISLGHVDPIVYSTLLAPLWGAHSYIVTKNRPPKMDNPDAK